MKRKLSTFALVLSALALGLLALAACNISPAPAQSLEPAGQSQSASEPLPQMAQGEAAFTGVIEAIGLDTYTVGGAIFKVDTDSQRPTDVTVGAAVQIRAHLNSDGSFYAQVISPAPAAFGGSGLRFEFEGTVQSISGETAIISGQPVQLSPALVSSLQVGDTVRVQGTLNAGVFRAQEVEHSDDDEDGTHTPEPTELREASETPEPTEERETTRTPEATERHEATRTPEATERHEVTRTPEPTERHEATRTPEPTERHEATHTPEPTEEREATHTPEPTEEREATRTPGPTEEREATRTPEPTEVHEATRTPEPTEAHEATHTPEPTEAHEATHTPGPND